jgi:hypothetical protein
VTRLTSWSTNIGINALWDTRLLLSLHGFTSESEATEHS